MENGTLYSLLGQLDFFLSINKTDLDVEKKTIGKFFHMN